MKKKCQLISVLLCFASAKMTLTKEDKAIIELLFKEKGWRSSRIVKEFLSKKWTHTSIDRLKEKSKQLGQLIELKEVASR